MPRRRRTPKKRNQELTRAQEWELLLGRKGESAFEDEDATREAWLQHRDELLANCVADHRPNAWWRFESPEKRKLGRRRWFVPQSVQLQRMREEGKIE